MDVCVVVCNAGAYYLGVDLEVIYGIGFLSRILRHVSLGRLDGPSAGVRGRNPSWNLAGCAGTSRSGSERLRGGWHRPQGRAKWLPSGSCQPFQILRYRSHPPFFTFPHRDVTLAAPLRLQERPGCVGGSRACRQQAWAGWQRQEFAWRCSERACQAGKEGERRRAGEGELALSPRVVIFSPEI